MEPPRKRIKMDGSENDIDILCDDMIYMLLYEYMPKWMWAVTARVCKRWYCMVHSMPFGKRRRTLLRKSTATGAVYCGAMSLTEWMLCDMGCPKEIGLCGAAVYTKRLDMVKHLRGLDCPWEPIVAYDAIATGDLLLARAIIEMGCPLNKLSLAGAVKSGSIDMIEYINAQGCFVSKTIFLSAPNLAIARWLYAHGHEPPLNAFVVAMSARWPLGELEALTEEMGVAPTSRAFVKAAAMDRRDVLSWLWDHWRHAFCDDVIRGLASKRDNHGMCVLVEHLPATAGSLTQNTIMCDAIARWPIADLEWLYGQGCAPTLKAVYAACIHGRINALEWLRAKGVMPDEPASYKAAICAQWDTLLWIAREGYPVDDNVARLLVREKMWDRLLSLCTILPLGWAAESLLAMPTDCSSTYLGFVMATLNRNHVGDQQDAIERGRQLCIEAAAADRFDLVDILMRTPFCPSPVTVLEALVRPKSEAERRSIAALIKRGYVECLIPKLWASIECCTESDILLGSANVASTLLLSASAVIAPLLFAIRPPE